MPRQLQDSFGHVRALTTVTPIVRGGTGADNAPQAVINLQGINRDRIDQPLGVAGSDHEGYLFRKYLENAGIFSGVTLEGPRILVHGNSPSFFISNFHTKSPPTISIDNASAEATLVRDNQYFTFVVPDGITELNITINERVYPFPVMANKPMKPKLLIKPDSLNKSFFYIEAAKFASLSPGNVGSPESWTALPHGETAVSFQDSSHTLYIQGWCGDQGKLHVDLGDDVFAFPKSFMRLEVQPDTARTIKLRVSDVEHARYVLLPNTLSHHATDWQVSLDAGFTQVIIDQVANTTDKTALPVNLGDGEYFVRCRYAAQVNAGMAYSDWSDTVKFKVDAELNAMNEYGIITDPLTVLSASYGSAVAVNETYLAVGASGDNSSYQSAGAVLLYRKEGHTHRLVNKISSPDVFSDALFGASVALTKDNMLFVGAPGHDGTGIVRQFNIVNDEPVFVANIDPVVTSTQFGTSVLVVNDILMVGDPGDTENGVNAGAVHVYRRGEAGYVHADVIYPTTPAAEDNFGAALASTKNLSHVFIGASSTDLNSSTFGKFYVFTNDEDVFTEALVRDSTLPAPGIRFARSLAYNQQFNKLYVGCEGDSLNGPNTGTVHVFTCALDETINVTYTESITPAVGINQGAFGSSIACSDDGYQLYVGSRGYRLNGATIGCVYFFT